MDDFPASVRGFRREPEADNASIDSDQQDIYAENDNPTQIVTFAPRERFKLGLFDCICLILNRTVGKCQLSYLHAHKCSLQPRMPS
jgi:hypothetical protein